MAIRHNGKTYVLPVFSDVFRKCSCNYNSQDIQNGDMGRSVECICTNPLRICTRPELNLTIISLNKTAQDDMTEYLILGTLNFRITLILNINSINMIMIAERLATCIFLGLIIHF